MKNDPTEGGYAGLGRLLGAVERMRGCQKEYFRTRSPHALLAAKKSEAAVDAAIKEENAKRAALLQPELLQEAGI